MEGVGGKEEGILTKIDTLPHSGVVVFVFLCLLF